MDFQNFKITRKDEIVEVKLPEIHIQCDVTNSSSGELINKYDILLQDALNSLSLEDLDELAKIIGDWFIYRQELTKDIPKIRLGEIFDKIDIGELEADNIFISKDTEQVWLEEKGRKVDSVKGK